MLPGEPNLIVGRDRELDALDRLAEAFLRGESRTLIIRVDAGIGKTVIPRDSAR